MTAPPCGGGGQNLDMALVLAGWSAKGKADPAFPAHGMPIGGWAAAVWNNVFPHQSLEKLIATAKKKVEGAIRPWSVCYGGAAAYIATCLRLSWRVVDAAEVITDPGKKHDLSLDPPMWWRWKPTKRCENGDGVES